MTEQEKKRMVLKIVVPITALLLLACSGASEPDLERPTQLWVNHQGHSTYIEWLGPSRADSFLVQYRQAGEEEWQEKVAEREIVLLFELPPGTDWEARIASQREGKVASNWSEVIRFTAPEWE